MSIHETTTIAISLHAVSKYYELVKALDEVTLTVPKGTILGLVGPNGAGKTTLMKILAGIFKPDLGSVRLFGKDLFFDYFETRKMIGYLPEKIILYPTLTGFEFLKFVSGLYNIDEQTFKERLAKYASRMKIEPYINTFLGTMSKGMLQKVVLTGIFIREPMIYLLDEPFYGLDPEGIWILRQLLREKANKGATVIVSSHILPLVEELCDRIAIIYKGKIHAEGTVKEISNWVGESKTLEEIFLKITGNNR